MYGKPGVSLLFQLGSLLNEVSWNIMNIEYFKANTAVGGPKSSTNSLRYSLTGITRKTSRIAEQKCFQKYMFSLKSWYCEIWRYGYDLLVWGYDICTATLCTAIICIYLFYCLDCIYFYLVPYTTFLSTSYFKYVLLEFFLWRRNFLWL